MRRIGTLSEVTLAERFRDFLTTQSIDAAIEPVGEASAEQEVWIRNEKDVVRARQLLEEFRASPQAPRFDVSAEAEKIRKQRINENLKKLKFQRKMPTSSAAIGGGRQQSIPITLAILVISVVTSFATSFGNPRPSRTANELSGEETLFFSLSFLDVRDIASLSDPTADPFASIKKGELWRLVTPLFLHGSTFHLLFNMLWIYSLGSMIERLHGSLFFLLLTLITQTIGMLVQVFFPESLGGSPFAIGASGAVYGLFGYLWIRPLVDPMFPIRLAPMNVALMLGWLVLCFTPILPGIANGAHLGGLIAGMASAPLLRRK